MAEFFKNTEFKNRPMAMTLKKNMISCVEDLLTQYNLMCFNKMKFFFLSSYTEKLAKKNKLITSRMSY